MIILETLSDEAVESALLELPGWEGDGKGLQKSLHFDTFEQAMRFMAECVPGIEQRAHHPIWTNKFNSVTIFLTTFDAGNRATARDLDLARFLDEVAQRCGARV